MTHTSPTQSHSRRRSPQLLSASLIAVLLVGNFDQVSAQRSRALPGPMTVTRTDNNGPGTLRYAILRANSGSFGNEITFAIGGVGPFVIKPETPLPALEREGIVIAGYSQLGSKKNSLNVNQGGSNATPWIVLDGSDCGGSGVWIKGDKCVVQGLIVHSFTTGIAISRNSEKSRIEGNIIGTDASGSDEIGNTGHGVSVFGLRHTIGGTKHWKRNVISGNGNSGIFLRGQICKIQGNLIGTDPAGELALPNGSDGIFVGLGGTPFDNLIGGTAFGARNIISGNVRAGIAFSSLCRGNRVEGNYLGTDVDGESAIPNFHGVQLYDCSMNTIGGTSPAAGNLISGNTNGVTLSSDSTFNTVQGNRIGTDAGGTLPIGNNTGIGDGFGVGSDNLFIENVIGFNAIGIRPDDRDTIRGNWIGTDKTGTLDLGNGVGIKFYESDCLAIENTIAFNTGTGVLVLTGAARNRISRNSIYSNGALGIDLSTTSTPNGVTPNDPGDADGGPNLLQNYPVLNASKAYSVTTSIFGSFDGAPNATFTLEFFTSGQFDPSGFGEGAVFLGSRTVTTDALGLANFSAVMSDIAPPGEYVTSTATDSDGNTSEFSAYVTTSQEDTLAYVTNHFGHSLTVIDASSYAVVATPSLGSYPHGIDISPDGATGFFTNYSPASSSAFDTTTLTAVATTGTVGFSGPLELQLSPDGTRAYVANTQGDTVSVIDTESFTTLATIGTGDYPRGIAVSPDGSRVYVANFLSDDVAVIDTTTNTVVSLIPVDGPMDVVVLPDNSSLLVASYDTDSVLIIDRATETVTATIPVGGGPICLCLNPSGTRLYATNYTTHTISVIDTALATELTQITSSGFNPFGIDITPDGSTLFVVNTATARVSIIDTGTNTVVATRLVGTNPAHVAISP